MSKYLIESGDCPPSQFHYYTFRALTDTAADRNAAEDTLKKQGCTRIYHSTLEVTPHNWCSYGIVETSDVVRARVTTPRY